ncbi:unnamed protein product [Ixodes persulcatus]
MEIPHGTLQRGTLEVRKDDFWEAISSNYDYLMNDELIASCREASGELALNEAGVSPPCETLSFAEFVQQFNLLHDWLHRLQSSMLDCDPERKSEMAALVRQELRQRETSLQLFAEEAQGLGALHPSMKEEVGRRVNLLSNKWDAVERAVDPDKDARTAPTQAFQEVAHEMRCLRRWLKELEARLPNQMAVSSSWTVPEIQDRLQAQQVRRMSGRSRRGKPTARPICALSFETGARDAPRRDRPRLAEPRSEPAGSNGYLAERRPANWSTNVAENVRHIFNGEMHAWLGIWLRKKAARCIFLRMFLVYSTTGEPSIIVGIMAGAGPTPAEDFVYLASAQPPAEGKHPPPLRDGARNEKERSVPNGKECREQGVMSGSSSVTKAPVSQQTLRLELVRTGLSTARLRRVGEQNCFGVGKKQAQTQLWQQYAGTTTLDRVKRGLPFISEFRVDWEYGGAVSLIAGRAQYAGVTESTHSARPKAVVDSGRVGGSGSVRASARPQCFREEASAAASAISPKAADRSEGDYDAPEEAAEGDRCVFAARAAAGWRGRGGVSGTESSSTPGLTHTPSLLPNGARSGRVGRVISHSPSKGPSECHLVPHCALVSSGRNGAEVKVRAAAAVTVGLPPTVLLSATRAAARRFPTLAAMMDFSPSPAALPGMGQRRLPASSPPRDAPAAAGRYNNGRTGASSSGIPSGLVLRRRTATSVEVAGSETNLRRVDAPFSFSLSNILGSSEGTKGIYLCSGKTCENIARSNNRHGYLSKRLPSVAQLPRSMRCSESNSWPQEPWYRSRHHRVPSTDKKRIPRAVSGRSFLRLRWSTSQNRIASQQSRIGHRSPYIFKFTPCSVRRPCFSKRLYDRRTVYELARARTGNRARVKRGSEPGGKLGPEPRPPLIRLGLRRGVVSLTGSSSLIARPDGSRSNCQSSFFLLRAVVSYLWQPYDCVVLKELLISQWEALVAELQGGSTTPKNSPRVRRQSMSDVSTEQQRADVLRSIGALREELTSVSELVQKPKEGRTSHAEHCGHPLGAVEQRAQELKVALSSLNDIRDSLVEVKAKAHRLAAEGSVDPVAAALGDHIQALHRQWSSAYQQSGAQLSELQMARSRATDALAPADLQGKKTVSLGGQMLDSAVAGQCGEMAGGVTRAPGRGRDVPAAEDEEKLPPGGSSGSRRLWRVLKAALPVQVALLLMYCVACLMEPHCCDLLNNFHASFGPQLRDIATECRWRGWPRHDSFTAISVYEEQIVP